MANSYPRLAARTLRFTLGIPRNLSVSPDGNRVLFVRTPDGVTRRGQLWECDVRSGAEHLMADPAELLDGSDELSATEQARRERSRESAEGIIAYATDRAHTRACFVLSGRLFVTDLTTRVTTEVAVAGSVVDPRLSPPGSHIAYATADGAFRLVDLASGEDRLLASPDHADESWGQAEFIAAEEMSRFRGHWWSPDGTGLLVQHTDESPVALWHVADPAHPQRAPRAQRYPAAGAANAHLRLWHIDVLTGERTEIVWDHAGYEYLARVTWAEGSAPVLQVLDRAQQHSLILDADPRTGTTTVVQEIRDDAWVELGPAPQRDPSGRLITCEDADGQRRICVDGEPTSGTDWYVRSVVDVFDDAILATASQDPNEVHVVRFGHDGSAEPLTTGAGVHHAVVGGGTTVIAATRASSTLTEVAVHTDTAPPLRLKVLSEPTPFQPEPRFLRLGDRGLSAAVLFPRDHVPGSKRLPLLMDPYGGPHAQRVLASGRMFLESQWLADQGFCVAVVDGRGTPGRNPAWEREIRHEFASVTLADQVDAVAAIAEQFPHDVDPARVGITGWSFGGYLAALAVLERPDVFHAAVAGAPVTDWRLYDTCYTERYLSDPDESPEVYDRNSLLPRAANLSRPLMLIHGLADDNVVVAHTLRLSALLTAAGKAHTVLPLSGVTHMTPQEEVAENLKLLQVDFLTRALA